MVENDSTIGYHLLCEKLTIKYSATDPVDIFLTTENGIQNKQIPLEIVFLRRNNAMYFFLMAPIKNATQLPIQTLLKIIKL